MPVSLAMRGAHADDARGLAAWQRVLASLRDADRMFSTYRDDAVISRLDRGELTLSQCPPEVHEVLALGERARRESSGAFNVRRRHPAGRLALDPSGVVKGWAVQRAAQLLAELPETDYCLSAGGDMVVHTTRADSPPWRVGIEDPFDATRLIATVPLRNGAVATSGLAHRGAHIVDPRTGAAATTLASVTVIAADLTWADIDATAAFALGAEGLDWLRGRPGRRGLVVTAVGDVHVFASRSQN